MRIDYPITSISRCVVPYVLERAKALGVRVVLDNENKYLDGDQTMGSEAYYSDDGVIAVSTIHQGWEFNLLHELSHAEQSNENCLAWCRCFVMGSDALEIADQWINGEKELSIGERFDVFNALYEVERDAERRTLCHMYKFSGTLYVDTSKYTRHAWAYINGYMYSYMIRQWLPADRPPYEIDSIVNSMPSSLAKEFVVSRPLWWEVYAKAYPELNQPSLSFAHRTPSVARYSDHWD